jgi:hypothetical protein
LIKAPEFENVAGFDKSVNGLWELKTEIRDSMVFVNFEVGNVDSGVDLAGCEGALKAWKVDEMKWTHEWRMKGEFNWKLAGQMAP